MLAVYVAISYDEEMTHRTNRCQENHQGLQCAWRASVIFIVAGCVTAFPEGGAKGQTIGPEATARGVTVMTRPRPEFDPLGVRLPGMRLDASLEGGVGYDDNLLPGQGEKRSGGFVEEAISVSAISDWTRHEVGATITQRTRQHIHDSDLNWNDYAVGLVGRYDIGRASWLRLRYDHIRSHLDVDDFDIQQSAMRTPVPYDTDSVQLAGLAAFNRLSLGSSVEYRWVRYQDVTVDGVRNQVSDDNYQTLLGEFTADYSFLPGRGILGLVRLQDISYDHSSRRGQDSFTWEVQGGFRYDIDSLWRAQFLVGYRHRDYEEAGRKPLSGMAFEGHLILLPTQLSTVTLTARRSIEESIRQDAVSYVRTAARLTWDHEILRNVVLSAGIGVEQRDYQEQGKVTDAIGVVEARWFLNRNLMLTATYQHTERLSAPSGFEEYGRNEVMIRLRFAL